DTGSGAGPPLTAWVVGEGVVLTASREKGEPVKVVLADGSERRVRAVRRPDAAPELTFLSVDGPLANPIPLASAQPGDAHLAAIGYFPEAKLAPGLMSEFPPTRLPHDCAIPAGAARAVLLSLDSGEAAGLQIDGDRAVSSVRIREAMSALGIAFPVPLASLESLEEDDFERRADPSE